MSEIIENEFNWYILRAVSGQEKKVKAYLETELARQNLSAFVPEILIPSEKIVELRNGKKVTREKISYPGYMYISANLSNGETFFILNNAPSSLGFLGEGKTKALKKPEPIKQSEINRILGKIEEGNLASFKSETKYLVGESVNVMNGPFTGFVGTIEEVYDDKKKVKVIVKIFGRNTPMELSYIEVEKAS